MDIKKVYFILVHMTQISKRYIQPWVMEKILHIFLSSIKKIKDENSAEEFFSEFLTPTEKLMLIKRISCFYLLYKNVPLRECSDILKISTATAAKYSIFLKKNEIISSILHDILKEEKFTRLVDTLLNEYLLPPGRLGSDWRTARMDKLIYEQRKKSPL